MSLPNVVIFYKDGEEVKREFTNCGWVDTDYAIKSGIKSSLEMIGDFEWDTAEAYGKIFKKEEIL